MELLPPELMQKIAFEYLEAEDVGRLKQVCRHTRITLHDDEYARDMHYAMMGSKWCFKRRLWTATRIAIKGGSTLNFDPKDMVAAREIFILFERLDLLKLFPPTSIRKCKLMIVFAATTTSLDFFAKLVTFVKTCIPKKKVWAAMLLILQEMIRVLPDREFIDWMMETQRFPKKAVMKVPLEAKHGHLAVLFNMRHGHKHLISLPRNSQNFDQSPVRPEM